MLEKNNALSIYPSVISITIILFFKTLVFLYLAKIMKFVQKMDTEATFVKMVSFKLYFG